MCEVHYKVCVICWTFNHSAWIEDAMNGFCQQETRFPFVCVIVDDHSTDGEQELLNKYLEQHFELLNETVAEKEETDDYQLSFAQHKSNTNCFFAVYNLKYNHRQVKKLKKPYLDKWATVSDYVAICEGDDYWLSPNKLQKQVEILEKNQNYSMVCNRTKLFSVKQDKFIGENYCYDKSRTVNPKDVINRTGLFISTCSIIYRAVINENVPSYVAKCKVGDYPLQIMCAMRGEIYYINDTMSVYRVENSNSWMGQQKWGKLSKERLEVIRSQVEMFEGFAVDFPTFRGILMDKLAEHINRNLPSRNFSVDVINQYILYFSDYINNYPMRWRIDLLIRKSRLPLVRQLYARFFLKKYSHRRMYYKIDN